VYFPGTEPPGRCVPFVFRFSRQVRENLLLEDFMQAFELAQLISERASSNKLYLEFLKVPDLSLGLYVLPAGGTDPQSPHTEEEIYYVVSGRAQILVGNENRAVQAGSIVYVAKNVAHRFHSIEEELTVLVFFAPAEYTNH
jgi:mannose-6-phosphate isomerase-like protein (cupin superfamily)